LSNQICEWICVHDVYGVDVFFPCFILYIGLLSQTYFYSL
jgi:hypothetical protein